jgi:uncharacterized protein (DUF58 family)
MAAHPQRKIDRRAVERVSHMEFRARQAVEGHYSGIHKSPYHGFNVEFAEYREYSPGDDPRYIDWRAMARTDRVFVKQFEAETNLNCYVLLDSSGSMDFEGKRGTRLDYAAGLAGAMTLLMLRQGDHAGLITFDTEVRRFIPPRGHARHFRVVAEALEHLKAGGDTGISHVLHDIAERVRRRSLIVVISDFFDDPAEVLRGLQHFRHRRHEVVVLHVVDEKEMEFPFDRVMLFEGMERGEEVVVDPRLIAADYRTRFAEFCETIRHGCAEKNIDYQRMMMGEPFDKALTTYLGWRKFRAAGGTRG